MPPTILKKFEIIKNIVRNNVISNINTKSISNSKKLYRRQVSSNNNTKTTTKPEPVESLPTVTLSPGPVTFTITSAISTSINPTDIIPSDILPDTNPIDTNINPTVTNTDISGTAPTVVSTSSDTTFFATTSTGVIGSSSGIIPSGIPVETSPIPPIPNVTTQSSSSSPSISPLPPPIASNNKAPNNLHAWLFPIFAISLIIMILAFLGFIYKKKNRNRNIKNNYIQNVGTGDMTDKDGSKTNSLTSSIHTVSSFRIKRGKVVPGDINIGSPPDPIAPILADNNDPSPIVTDNNDERKLKRPMLKHTPTTVSAFTELVDLTDEENASLRQSVASRLSSTPSYVNNIDYDMEENNPSNTAIPLHQERVDAIIPFSFANEGGGSSASASGSGTRTFIAPPFNNIVNDNDNVNQ